MPTAAIRALLGGLVDYAGLFPPAALSMTDVVKNYDSYRHGPQSWMLGRLVLPMARLGEFEEEAASRLGGGPPWRLSVLGDAREPEGIERFNARLEGRAVIDSIEAKAATVEEIGRLGSATITAPRGEPVRMYVEFPIATDPTSLVRAVSAHGYRAKVRTGGVTENAFPASARIVTFLEACQVYDVPFKATAGLHHPVRGEFPLTYEPGSACGTMWGFLNVFVAALLLRQGAGPDVATQALEERDLTAFAGDDEAVTWRRHRLPLQAVAAGRATFATSFGSCSFTEPVGDLMTQGIL